MFEAFGLVHDAPGHGGNLLHELFVVKLGALDLLELEFPVAGQFRRAEFRHRQPAQEGDQREGLGGGLEFAALAHQVPFIQQPFDNRGAGGGGAQTLGQHGLAQFLVVHQFARAFHGGKQRGFRETRRRTGLQPLDFHADSLHGFARGDRRQVGRGVVRRQGAPVNFEPAGADQHFPFAFEVFARSRGDAGGDQVFRRRIKHRQKPADNQIINLAIVFRQIPGRLNGGNDRKMVGNLGVVENTAVGLDPAVLQDGGCQRAVGPAAEIGQHLADGGLVIFGQGAGIRAGISQHFVPFIKRLGDLQRAPGGESEAGVGFALQAGQVEEQRR